MRFLSACNRFRLAVLGAIALIILATVIAKHLGLGA